MKLKNEDKFKELEHNLKENYIAVTIVYLIIFSAGFCLGIIAG